MTSNSKILERCFPQKSLVAYSRPKNLKDELIRARISTRKKSGRLKNGYSPCQEGCQCCWISKKATTHTNFMTKETWQITSPINCKTRNVVYKLGCDLDKRECKLFTSRAGLVLLKFLLLLGGLLSLWVTFSFLAHSP